MSEGGWSAEAWSGEDRARERLPSIEDLPIAEHGYDREAVQEAFDAFYRHSAQLDATLRMLESVEAFSRQARELRADIRSLRAASWGPAPSARHVWSAGHEAWSIETSAGAVPEALPRLAIWTALIVAVGVGAALAELSAALVVLLVVAAWAVVALVEAGLAARRAVRRRPLPAPLGPPQRVEPAARSTASASVGQATMIEPAVPARATTEADVDEAPSEIVPAEAMAEALRGEPAQAAPRDVEQPVAADPEADVAEEGAGEVVEAAERVEARAPEAELAVAAVPAHEPAPAAEAGADLRDEAEDGFEPGPPVEDEPAGRGWRLWRRREEPAVAPAVPPEEVEVPWEAPAGVDPWEQGAEPQDAQPPTEAEERREEPAEDTGELPPAAEPVAAPAVSRRLRRGRR